MIDTVQLRHQSKMPLPSELLALGWSSRCGHGESDKYYFNRPNSPRLTWTKREDADWLTAETSLPKFFCGDNVRSLNQSEIETALSDVGNYVEQAAQTEFDVPSALVGRVDYCHNFKLNDETDVKKYIRAFQRVRVSKYDTQAINDSTVTLHAKSRQTCIYSKFDELRNAKEKPAFDLLRRSKGVLRIEPRFLKSSSVAALAKRVGTVRTAGEMLQEKVWKKVMTSELKRVGADKPVLSAAMRQQKLIESFGFAKASRLAGILHMRDEQGESFIREQMPRSTYQRIKKELLELGLWLDAGQVELPALTIVERGLLF